MWAAAAGDSGSSLTEWMQLVNLPLSILMLYGLARGWFITGKEHDRVVKERDQERLERIAAQEKVSELTNRVLPVLQENERTMADMVRAAERLQDSRRKT